MIIIPAALVILDVCRFTESNSADVGANRKEINPFQRRDLKFSLANS